MLAVQLQYHTVASGNAFNCISRALAVWKKLGISAGGFQGRGMPGRGGPFGSFGMSAGMDGGGPMMMEMGEKAAT